jgi:hypothetical protein
MALFFTHFLSVLLWLHSCFVLAVPQQNGLTDLSILPKVSRVRTFILTDILNEPDDSMSMVRYLLYSNEFDTRGLVAVTSWSLRNDTHPSEIKKIIKVYAKVVDKLNQHVHPDNRYPEPEELLKQISSGPRVSFLVIHIVSQANPISHMDERPSRSISAMAPNSL